MKKIIILLVCVLTTKTLFAHGCHPELVNCPIDGAEIKFCVIGASAAFGNYTDFQLQVDEDRFYEEQIRSCPKCHFSGHLSDFKVVYTDKEKAKIKGFLSKFNGIKIDDVTECQMAGQLKEFLKESNDKIANCFLIGSYILKMKPKSVVQRKELQNKAKHFFIRAMAYKEYSDPNEIASINYLIAELYRRTGDFKNAVKYYDEVIKSSKKSPWIEEMVTIQKKLAVNKDDNNKI